MSIWKISSVVRLKADVGIASGSERAARLNSQYRSRDPTQYNSEEEKEMKYLLLIYDAEQSWNSLSESERQQIYGEYRQLREQLQSKGQFLGGSQLQPVTTATSIRVRDGKALVTDGPFAETHEQLGGYFLIEAKDLDEANGIAARIPSARMGTVEVRPLVERPAEATA
jgi:hypothetical protein